MLLAAGCALAFLASASADHWPRFRGPNGYGVSTAQNIPVRFGEDNGILWKVKLPGVGNSSPVIWGKRMFLQASKADGSERMLLCLNVDDGKVLWTRSAPASKVRTHAKNSMASSTPTTDGERVYVVFWSGTAQTMHAYDFEGKPLWQQGLGAFISRDQKAQGGEMNQHGAGASPVVYGDKVYFNNDQTGSAVLVALDAKTGKIAWEAKRDAFRTCYSTPFLHEPPGQVPELILSSTAGITSYEPNTGKVNWHWKWTTFESMALRTVGAAIYSNGLFVAISGDGSGARHAVAIRADDKGNVTDTHLIWQEKRRIFPYVPCMLTVGEHLYTVRDGAAAHAQCHEAKTGKQVWEERLNAPVSASPVLIDGKVYVITEDGTVFVYPAMTKFELLAKNALGEKVIASPAVADGKLFIRGQEHLYCIGAPTAQ